MSAVEKAVDLINTGAVRKDEFGLGGGASVWRVASGPGIVHLVVIRGTRYACDCDASRYGQECSHGLAALFTARNKPETKAAITRTRELKAQ